MSAARRAACTAGALLALAAAPSSACASVCALVFGEHRSGVERLRLPLPAGPEPLRILFTHSVLGTPVEDRYEWRATPSGWQAHLVEERFEGQGYGLPSAAEPGQRLLQEGPVSRLLLDRAVHPLVVRPLPTQGMRVVVGDSPAPIVLAALSRESLQLSLSGCERP